MRRLQRPKRLPGVIVDDPHKPPPINMRLARAVAMNVRGLRAVVFEIPQAPPKPALPNRKTRRAMAANKKKR